MESSSPEYLAQCRDALNLEQSESLEKSENWSHVDRQKVHIDWDALYKELAPIIDDSSASSPEIQSIIARHYSIVSRFYAPSRQAYIGMSLFYRENFDMKVFHNSYHPRMVDFLGEAIYIYAHQNL